jgi:capsular exopolysaccharide synthesis family protein
MMGGLPNMRLQIDVGRLLRAVLRRLWMILLVGAVLGSALYFQAKTNVYTIYRTTTTLAFTKVSYVEQTEMLDDGSKRIVSVPVKAYYSTAEPERLSQLMHSDALVARMMEALNNKYPEDPLRASISIAEVANVKGFFVLTVENADASFCNEVLEKLVVVYPDYLRRFESTLGVEIINSPKPAQVAVNSDNSNQMAMLGFLAGSGAVTVLICVLELMKNTIRSAGDIRSKTSEKLLGMVPYIVPRGRKQKGSERALTINDKQAVSFDFVENVKAIRTKLENIAAEKDAKVFAVTSTFESEGKTTLSINLACALAQKGKSVLLVDCDLRKPAVLKGLGIKDSDSYGLIPTLNGKSSYEDSVKYVKAMRFFVLSTGGSSNNSIELLGLDKIKAIFQKAREEFDYIILDTPPAKVVADFMTLAPHIDGLVYAIRNDYARANHINETMEEINNAGIRILGSVLTMATADGRIIGRNSYRYRYRRPSKYYGGYGYGYGYGAEPSSRGGYGYGYGENGEHTSGTKRKRFSQEDE